MKMNKLVFLGGGFAMLLATLLQWIVTPVILLFFLIALVYGKAVDLYYEFKSIFRVEIISI